MRNSFLLFLTVYTTLNACRTPEQVTVIKNEPAAAAPAPVTMRTWSGRLAEAGITTWQYGTHTLTGVEYQDTIVRPVKTVLFAVKSSSIYLDSYNGKDVILSGYYVDGYPVDGGPQLIEVVAVKDKKDADPYIPPVQETKNRIRDCPEEKIENLFPTPIDKGAKTPPRTYFIYKGQRREIDEFDLEWLKQFCTIPVHSTY